MDNTNFPPAVKDIKQLEKDNFDISITIFEYSVFHKIKEDITIMKMLKKV